MPKDQLFKEDSDWWQNARLNLGGKGAEQEGSEIRGCRAVRRTGDGAGAGVLKEFGFYREIRQIRGRKQKRQPTFGVTGATCRRCLFAYFAWFALLPNRTSRERIGLSLL